MKQWLAIARVASTAIHRSKASIPLVNPCLRGLLHSPYQQPHISALQRILAWQPLRAASNRPSEETAAAQSARPSAPNKTQATAPEPEPEPATSSTKTNAQGKTTTPPSSSHNSNPNPHSNPSPASASASSSNSGSKGSSEQEQAAKPMPLTSSQQQESIQPEGDPTLQGFIDTLRKGWRELNARHPYAVEMAVRLLTKLGELIIQGMINGMAKQHRKSMGLGQSGANIDYGKVLKELKNKASESQSKSKFKAATKVQPKSHPWGDMFEGLKHKEVLNDKYDKSSGRGVWDNLNRKEELVDKYDKSSGGSRDSSYARAWRGDNSQSTKSGNSSK